MAQPLPLQDQTARQSVPSVSSPDKHKCRLCDAGLNPLEGDDLKNRLCTSCVGRPEVSRLGIGVKPAAPRRPHLRSVEPGKPAREFTPAEMVLISKVHSLMPMQSLLDLLNERLICDLGPDAGRYTIEQLQAQVSKFSAPGAGLVQAGPLDWASLRKLLAAARRNGVLGHVNEQVISDFAVVFGLNLKQVTTLKDILLNAKEGS